MSVIYHLDKENIVFDALSKLSLESVAHVKEGKKHLAKEVLRLAHLVVYLTDFNDGVVIVQNG